MKKVAIWIAVFALVVGGGIAVLWDVPNWRLYDANWRALAMTEAESYCAGLLLGEGKAGYDDPNPEEAALCWENTSKDNTMPQISKVVEWGCQGLLAAVEWNLADCIAAVESNDIWWLRDGGFTASWNSGNSRPNVVTDDIRQAPRGGRESEDRLGA